MPVLIQETIRNRRFMALAILLGLSAVIAGCSSKKAKPENETYAASASEGTSGAVGGDGMSSDQGNAYGLKTVHFSFDSQALDEAAKSLLKADAQILVKNPVLRVQVEGHCDSRGGIQYNVALGERRAISVKHFLEDLGVRPERIATVSFGKERPLDPAETEEAFAKNRRANFVVTLGMM